MIPKQFRCLLVEQLDSEIHASLQTLASERLPPGNVTIQVEYSALNYKDALAFQGHRGVAKSLPHVPGIDAVGTVVATQNSRFAIGDKVLVTGNDLGQGHWGGWAELIRVPDAWIVPVPETLSARDAIALGTAGFTAAQCVLALQRNGTQTDAGKILVTGATGGVGSWSVRLLAHLGYNVTAVTGKPERRQWLHAMGAAEVADRKAVTDTSQRPLLSAQWAGAIDTVGGDILTSILRSTRYGGCVAACGLVAGAQLSMTLYPFLLRGVSLCGIASADCPYAQRQRIWQLLAHQWKTPEIDDFITEVDLPQLAEQVANILAGKIVGRVVVRL